jgi:hypothetical protein
MGMRPAAIVGCSVCRGSVYYSRLLVHIFDFVCQPSSHNRPGCIRHVFGYPSGGRTWLCPCATRGCDGRDAPFPLAGAFASEGGFQRCGCPRAKGNDPCLIRSESLSCALEIRPGAKWQRAFLRHDAGDRFEVFSARTKPSQVRPEASTTF